jgi:hypothetical protein
MLGSYRLKLDRAQEHLGALDAKISAWRNSDPKPYVVSTQLDPEKLERVWRIHIREQPPDAWSALIGDFLHNTRSALDHMAYLLAEVNNPDQTRKDRAKITFPICDRPGHWPRPNSPKIRAIEARARAEIERAQPYSAIAKGVTDPAIRVLFARTQPLWILHQLNNADKHRFVRAAFISVPETIIGTKRMGAPYEVYSPPPGIMLEDNAVVARVTFTDLEDAMNMANGPVIQECLNEWDFLGPVYWPPPSVIDRLGGLLDKVKGVIKSLEPFLA